MADLVDLSRSLAHPFELVCLELEVARELIGEGRESGEIRATFDLGAVPVTFAVVGRAIVDRVTNAIVPRRRLAELAERCTPHARSDHGSFTEGPALDGPRHEHSAVKLVDGSILVVGGTSGERTLKSALVLAPGATTWTRTGSLRIARRDALLLALPDGGALIVGGRDPQNRPIAEAERLVRAESVWKPAGALNMARSGAAGALLADGRVLVVGGDLATPRLRLRNWTGMGYEFVLSPSPAEAEQWNPERSEWQPTASPNVAFVEATLTTTRAGSILGIGAAWVNAPGETGTVQIERFDPVTSTWAALGNANRCNRVEAAVPIADDAVFFTGDQSYPLMGAFTEIWSGATASPAASLPRSSSAPTLSAISSDEVLAVGGEQASAWRWVRGADAWVRAGLLRQARRGHTATVASDGRVVVIGGLSQGLPLASTELWTR